MMNHKWVDGSWARGYGDVAHLVLRAALGAIFMYHGYDKVFTMGVPNVAGFLGSIGIPLPEIMAFILAYGELIFGLCLILGLFTYIAAKFAVIVGIVAFFTVHLPNGFPITQGGYEYIVLITAAAIAIIIEGPGRYSLDAMWRKS